MDAFGKERRLLSGYWAGYGFSEICLHKRREYVRINTSEINREQVCSGIPYTNSENTHKKNFLAGHMVGRV